MRGAACYSKSVRNCTVTALEVAQLWSTFFTRLLRLHWEWVTGLGTAFICMMPKAWRPEDVLAKKIATYRRGVGTTHFQPPQPTLF